MASNSGLIKLFCLYARYNFWFNQKLFTLLAKQNFDLSIESKRVPVGAILRQLNHVFVMDLIWLNRFKSTLCAAGDPEPGLDALPAAPVLIEQILFFQFNEFILPRLDLDNNIIHFTENLTDDRFEMPVSFRTLADKFDMTRPLWALLLHLFNHQSLHRGEIIAHLNQLKIDIGATDILPLIAETC